MKLKVRKWLRKHGFDVKFFAIMIPIMLIVGFFIVREISRVGQYGGGVVENKVWGEWIGAYVVTIKLDSGENHVLTWQYKYECKKPLPLGVHLKQFDIYDSRELTWFWYDNEEIYYEA